MKKNLTKITGIALASLALLLVGCPDPNNGGKNPEKEDTPKIEPTIKPDADADTIHAMILPHGTEAVIAPWEKASDSLADNLPAFVTNFSDFKKIKIINTKGREIEYDTQELNGNTNRTDELKAAVKEAVKNNSFAGRKPKNVIIIFGDGMGESHIVASRHYYGELMMDLLPYHAPVNHDSYMHPGEGALPLTETTDSSAGGSAITTGFKTRYGFIGIDAAGTPVKNLTELAREKGMIVGNVTNDHMADATPATVGVHVVNRNYQDLAYSKLFISSPDIAMGSDYGYSTYIQEEKWNGSGRKSVESIFAGYDTKVKDKYGNGTEEYKASSPVVWYEANKTLLQKWANQMLGRDGDTYDFNDWYKDRNMHSYSKFTDLVNAVQADYTIRPISNYEYHANYEYTPSKTTAPKFGYKLGYGAKNTTLPTYPEMVAATLSVLDHKAKANNDSGFFCLIENTVSDGWGHASQPYDCINEIQCFDEGLAIALKYVLENPDTLLVVTADHETGGLEYRSNWDTNYKRIISSTSGHSSKPVPVYAFGAGAEEWKGYESFDTSTWTADDWAKYVAGKRAGTDYSYQNRQTGIRIARAMGFDKFGDLNENGFLDPDTESDSVVDEVMTYSKFANK